MSSLNARMVLSLVEQVSGPAGKAESALKSVSSQARRLVGFRFMSGGVDRLGTGLTRLGRLGRQALGGLFGLAVQFEQEMQNVRSVFFEDPGDVLFGQMTEKAKELGAVTRFTASESAQAMFFMAQAGLDADQVLQGVGHTLNLAAAGNLGLSQAADIATDVMKQFGLEVKDLGRVADTLTVGSQSATTNVQKLGMGLSKVGPLARQYGISLEEATAFTAAFADVGLKGGIGGRTFRRILLQLISPSKKSREALRSLGVNKEVIAKGPRAALIEISKRLNEVGDDPKKRLKFLNRLAVAFRAFGVGGAAAAAADFAKGLEKTNKNGESVVDIMKILDRATSGYNRALDTASKRLDTTSGDILLLKSVTETLALELGDLAFPREVLTSARDMVKSILDWAKANPDLASGLVKVAIATTAVSTVFGPLLSFGAGALRLFVDLKFAALLLGGSGGALSLVSSSIIGLGKLALVGGAFSLGFMLGEWLDKALGLSDAIAGVNQQLGQPKRSAPALLGSLTEEERTRLNAAKTEKEAAQAKQKTGFEGFARSYLLSGFGANFLFGSDDRIKAAQSEIDRINTIGNERQSRVALEINVNGPASVTGVRGDDNTDVTAITSGGLQSAGAGL